MHYKTKQNQLFFEPSKEVIEKFKLEEISKEEFDLILEENNKPDLKQIRISELEELFAKTDYKFTGDYATRSYVDKEELAKLAKEREEWAIELKGLLRDVKDTEISKG